MTVTIIDTGPVAHDGETGAPELVSMTPGAGATATARYRLGSFSIPLAIELWCATEYERDRRIEQIQAALNEPPTVSGEAVADVLAGLTLPVSDYFNAPCTFDSDGWLVTKHAPGPSQSAPKLPKPPASSTPTSSKASSVPKSSNGKTSLTAAPKLSLAAKPFSAPKARTISCRTATSATSSLTRTKLH
jgi:hypothetical protein